MCELINKLYSNYIDIKYISKIVMFGCYFLSKNYARCIKIYTKYLDQKM